MCGSSWRHAVLPICRVGLEPLKASQRICAAVRVSIRQPCADKPGASTSPSHIFGIVTRCRSFTRVRLLLLLLLLLPPLPPALPAVLPLPPLLLLFPVTMATPSVGLKPSLSRMAGVMRER